MITYLGSASNEYGAAGTNAERLALTLNANQAGFVFYPSDSIGDVWTWYGSYWVKTITDGAVHVTDPSYSLVKYSGGGYTYYAEAAIGTARSTAAWRVSRITDATGDALYAGTGLFAHAATSLAVVAALTYTLGA